MIEKWKKNVDNGGVFGALLTDLSKVFDCIPHDLIIAKLEAYRFHINALYSSWKDIVYCLPQRSILGPLLFNIYLCELFYFLEDVDIASYADDTTVYTVSKKKRVSH